MSNPDLIRAWKDDDYRMSLSDAERAQLAENPIGYLELTDEDLKAVADGVVLPYSYPYVCCRHSDMYLYKVGSSLMTAEKSANAVSV